MASGVVQAFSCTVGKPEAPSAAKSPEVSHGRQGRALSGTKQGPATRPHAEQAEPAAPGVGSSPPTGKRSRLSPAPAPPASTAKRQKQKPDLSQAPGVPARLGSKPLRLIIVGANPSEHAW